MVIAYSPPTFWKNGHAFSGCAPRSRAYARTMSFLASLPSAMRLALLVDPWPRSVISTTLTKVASACLKSPRL